MRAELQWTFRYRSIKTPGSNRRANAAINRAAASMSATDTISIGECM